VRRHRERQRIAEDRLVLRLPRPLLDYFRRFYADTALSGSAIGIRCGLDFFGADHVLFGSDCPFDPEGGPMYIRETIRVIDALDITDAARDQVYQHNILRLMRLPDGRA
jgi:predicted TIM-barrel fold metal-dependent hydrolase